MSLVKIGVQALVLLNWMSAVGSCALAQHGREVYREQEDRR